MERRREREQEVQQEEEEWGRGWAEMGEELKKTVFLQKPRPSGEMELH